jgi:hypothetical protein
MRYLLLILILMLPTLAQAVSVELLWEFDPESLPPPDRFLLTLTRPESTEVFSVPPSVQGSCGRGQDITPQTYCAVLPSCPQDGVYQFEVQAEWDALGRSEAQENVLVCVMSLEIPCRCLAESSTPITPGGQFPPGSETPTAPSAPTPPSSPASVPSQTPGPGQTPAPASPQTPPQMPTFPQLPPRSAPV